jgi:predicted RecB family nuclease
MISNEAFVAFLNCRRKGFFKQEGQAGEVSQIEQVFLQLDRVYARTALKWFLGKHQEDEISSDPPLLETAIQKRPRFIVGATAQAGNLSSHLDLLERVDRRGKALYAPMLLVRGKVSRNDRLLLGFQALTFSLVQGALPTAGKIIHGIEHRVVQVQLASLVEEARGLVAQMENELASKALPTLTLNRHCAACEFRRACLALAEETDNLSLLRFMPEKEIQKQRSHGVTTVTQFSYTYRPGRRGKRRSGKARKHDPALQALALREKKVYVMDAPVLTRPEMALYLDIEGVPEQNFYYLIGLLVVDEQGSRFHQFWAEDPSQEKDIWNACLQVIQGFPEYTLYHYGQYEKRFLDKRKKLANEEERAGIERVLARSCNLLSVIHSHIYFPTRSNGLKDIAGLLSFKWSVEGASGLQALAWRLAWEAGKEEILKEKLLLYNQEDCFALKKVAEFVIAACVGSCPGPTEGQPAVADVEDIQRPKNCRLGKAKFCFPELEHINKCAYSNYQREKVYVRTSSAVRRSLKRKAREGRRNLKVNQQVSCPPPENCPECRDSRIRDLNRPPYHKLLFDLKYTRSGVRREVVRLASYRYQCLSCRVTFYADLYRTSRTQFGHNLSSWAIYQHVALRQSYEEVTDGLNELFGFSFSYGVLKHIKPDMASRYQPVYDKLKEKLRCGPLVHADETTALVKGHSGYVWAFTNLEEVLYVYTSTRDGEILEQVLEGFKGVLVSDFYSAYDSPDCSQQKCLIHLIRDINDDLFHNPFDEELKQVAQRFVGILKPMIDTIDAHGLKCHFLHKHKKEADSFFRYLAKAPFPSELAQHYQKRMLKYREKLFTFLDHDGVPWNNNNAEVAIKLFAARRRMMGASFTEKGMQDYLVFLSIFQTCRNKNVSFLRFLRSGLLDLDAFTEGLCSR